MAIGRLIGKIKGANGMIIRDRRVGEPTPNNGEVTHDIWEIAIISRDNGTNLENTQINGPISKEM